MRSEIPLLQQVKVSSPCLESWEDMEGDERVRHCAGCKHNVYNLSDMTQKEAEALLQTREGRLCVRYYQRPDGTVMTKDCPTGLRALRQRALRKWVAISYAAVALALGFWRVAGSKLCELAEDIGIKSREEPVVTASPFAPGGEPLAKAPMQLNTAKPESDSAIMGMPIFPPKK